MKKIILLPLLVFGFVHASEVTETKISAQIETMKGLERGMSSIQKGLMYNNKNIIKKGVEEIQAYTKDIDSFDIKNERDISFNIKIYSQTEAKAISKLADDMIEGFNKGSKNRVLDIYRRMQNRCMTCHDLVRKW